jgi:hypothetical protein
MDRQQRHALTARIAYSLFEHRGRDHGRDRDDWLQAERIIGLVDACAALLEARSSMRTARRGEPASELAPTGLERRALEALAAAVERGGRAAAAAALGYASTSAVSAVLGGRRALRRDLAERILAAFEAPGEGEARLRVLDGGAGVGVEEDVEEDEEQRRRATA